MPDKGGKTVGTRVDETLDIGRKTWAKRPGCSGWGCLWQLILGFIIVTLLLAACRSLRFGGSNFWTQFTCWWNGNTWAECANIPDSTPTPGPISTPTRPLKTPIGPVAPTPGPDTTPVAPTSETCWLIGGRLDPDENGYEWIAKADCEFLADGTPLQMYLEQVTDNSFANPLDLPQNHEVLNDGLQFVIRNDVALVMPMDGSPTFWEISHITKTNDGLVVCEHDNGVSGDWVGGCGGASVLVSGAMPLSGLMSSKLFSPWADEFSKVVTDTTPPFNQKVEVVVTFRRNN